MRQALVEGRLAEARERWHTLVPKIAALTSEPNPTSAKAAFAQLGLIRNVLRSPMAPGSADLCARLARMPLA